MAKTLEQEQRCEEQARSIKHEPSVCRFCGCTPQRACRGGCGWAESSHTVCTASGCIAKLMPLAQEAASAFVSPACACGGRKRSGYWFCVRCTRDLPWTFTMFTITPKEPLRAAVRYSDAKAYLAQFVWEKKPTMRLNVDTALMLEAERAADSDTTEKVVDAQQIYLNCVHLANETGKDEWREAAAKAETDLRNVLASMTPKAAAAAVGSVA